MDDLNLDALANELEAAINDLAHEAVEQVIRERGSLDGVTLQQIMAGHLLDKQGRRDLLRTGNSADAREMLLNARKTEMDTRRKRRARAKTRQDKREQARESKPLDPTRMKACLAIVGNVVDLVHKITSARYNHFRAVLGETEVQDIAQNVVIALGQALARTDHDLVDLAQGALWLADQPGIPQRTHGGPRVAGDIIRLLHKIAQRSIVDTYRANTTRGWRRNPLNDQWEQFDNTLTSFELLETMAAQTNVIPESLIANSLMLDHRFQDPGKLDRVFTRLCIDAWITARDLDWLADLLLDDDNRRTDGFVKWTQVGAQVWQGLGLPMIEATPAVMGELAKQATQECFAELPMVVTTAYDLAGDLLFMADVHHQADIKMILRSAKEYRSNHHSYLLSMPTGVMWETNEKIVTNKDALRRALCAVMESELDSRASCHA